jgi:hexosaminidase
VVEGDSLATTAAWFTEQVQTLTGVQLRQGRGGKQAIILDITHQDKSGIHPNGYSLSVTPSGIRITAADPAGIFYGLQTLLQLIPAGQSPAIPCADITDYPRFAWRGLMLDVSRHFFTKQEVERYIDDMVRYKYNTCIYISVMTRDGGSRSKACLN